MYKNILVPISFDEDRDASAAIAVAQALAEPDAKITLIHVMEHIPAYAITYMPGEYLSESRKAIETDLERRADALSNGDAVVIEGHSGRTIVDWAERNKVDCIVVASHRPGVQDYFLGSTAAQVVRHAPCAVHVIR